MCDLSSFPKQDCHQFWTTFRARDNHAVVLSHKLFIRKAFERLREHLPTLSAAGDSVILAHDDSKLSFLEMVGYTDCWIWSNRSSAVWKRGTCAIEVLLIIAYQTMLYYVLFPYSIAASLQPQQPPPRILSRER